MNEIIIDFYIKLESVVYHPHVSTKSHIIEIMTTRRHQQTSEKKYSESEVFYVFFLMLFTSPIYLVSSLLTFVIETIIMLTEDAVPQIKNIFFAYMY